MPNPGVLQKLWVGASAGAAILVDFIDESLRSRYNYFNTNGTKGSRADYVDRTVPALLVVGGRISMYPTTFDLDWWLPYILGGTKSGTSYPLADTLTAFTAWKKIGTEVHIFSLQVARAIFSSRPGEPLRMDLDCIGTTYSTTTYSSGTHPASSIVINQGNALLAHHNMTCSIGGTAFQVSDLSLMIDNMVTPRWVNSRTATQLYANRRVITVAHDLPQQQTSLAFTDFTDAQRAVVLTYNSISASESLIFNMGAVRYANELYTIPAGPVEVMYPLGGEAMIDAASDAQVIVTLDSTP